MRYEIEGFTGGPFAGRESSVFRSLESLPALRISKPRRSALSRMVNKIERFEKARLAASTSQAVPL